MKQQWFKEWGWIYYPISWQGVVVIIFALLFCLHIFIFANFKTHSVSDLFYGVFPFVVPTLLVLEWIARKTSK